jgi:hypothetical protein
MGQLDSSCTAPRLVGPAGPGEEVRNADLAGLARGVAAQVDELESKGLKPGCHFIHRLKG